MSGSAVLALAPMLAPPTPGSAAPGAPASEPGVRAFDGVLADTGAASVDAEPVDPGATPTASAGAAPVEAKPAADATQALAAAPPAVAVLPAMNDPATTSVLNALALRVATEARTATSAVAGVAIPPAMATAGVDPAVAATQAATTLPAALAAASTASLAASMPAGLAAMATTAGMPASVRGAASTASGTGAIPLASAMAADADPGALDQLLSTLDALLPGAPTAATSGTSGSGVASVPMAATAAPLAPPLPATPAILPGGDVAKAALEALIEPSPDGGGDPAAGASPLPTAVPGAAGAPVLQTATSTVASFAAAVPRADGAQPPIQVPFDSPQWGNELTTRVVSLAREQFSEAEIRVTPDELGPIEVKLRFEGDRVHAQFGAISPEAREALTANLHRLREMFAGEGLNLGQAFVGHHGQDAGRRFEGQTSRGGGSGSEGDDDVAAIAPRVSVAARRGLLDEFA